MNDDPKLPEGFYIDDQCDDEHDCFIACHNDGWCGLERDCYAIAVEDAGEEHQRRGTHQRRGVHEDAEQVARHVGVVTGRAHERAMLKVLCKSAISRVFDGLELVGIQEEVANEEAASEDVFFKEIQEWGDGPKELLDKGRYELIWLVKREEGLCQQATSQCERAQKEREQWKRRAEKLWQLLDDIDTAGDQYKGDWVKLREFIWRTVARRGEILVSDGHTLSVPEGE